LNKIALDRKLKTILLIPVILLSAVAVLGTTPVLPVFATANLSISPAVLSDTCLPPSPGSGCTHGLGVGATFNYTVIASGIGGTTGTLFAYQYEIHYNPAILQAVSVVSFGPFFDALLGGGFAVPVSIIDNANGIVSMAVSSTGPSTSFLTTTLIIGQVTFSVAGLGRSDQSLQNSILIHNSGGGVITNIPATTSGALFSNVGLFGRADFPSVSSGIRMAWPEDVTYSIALDNSFTPGIVDFFGNVNSTGTLPVVAFIRFTLTSDFGTFVRQTTTQQYGPGEVSVVPQFTGYDPAPGGTLQVGTFDVQAQVFYQQVNLDNSLGPIRAGETIKDFRFVVIPSNPTTTALSCSPSTGVNRRTLCTAVVGTSDPQHLTGIVSFGSSVAGIFKPSTCAPDNQGTCSVFFYPRSAGGATVTATYSGDTGGKTGHGASSGSTTVTVTGHPTTTVVSCSPGTVNAPTRTTSTCTVTVTDTSSTPENVNGTVTFRSTKSSFWDPIACTGNAGIPCPPISPECTLSPTSVTGVSSCTVTYKPNRNNAAVCNPSAGCMATIRVSYGVSNVPNTGGFFIPDGDLGDAIHLTSGGSTTISITGHQTKTSVRCSPSAIRVNATTTCTVTVTDTDALSPVAPTGIVLFGHDGGLSPSGFSPDFCTLSPISASQSSCSVTYTANNTVSEHLIFARYRGDSTHVRTTGTTTIKVSA